MKTKNLWYLLAFVVAAVLSVNFVACSKDDEEEGGGSVDTTLVGKWCGDSSEDYFEEWTFKSDGTGERHTDDRTVGTYDKFTYSIASSNRQSDSYYGYTISGKVDVKYTNSGNQKTYSFYKEGDSWLKIDGYQLKKEK